MKTAIEAQMQALRDGMTTMLAECTKQQVDFLHRIHDNAPWNGLANCPDEQLAESYDLLLRTVSANRSASVQS